MLATFTSTISKEYNINIVTLLTPLSDLHCYDLNFLSNVFSLTICVVAQEGGKEYYSAFEQRRNISPCLDQESRL
jgi:hypothetical protein